MKCAARQTIARHPPQSQRRCSRTAVLAKAQYSPSTKVSGACDRAARCHNTFMNLTCWRAQGQPETLEYRCFIQQKGMLPVRPVTSSTLPVSSLPALGTYVIVADRAEHLTLARHPPECRERPAQLCVRDPQGVLRQDGGCHSEAPLARSLCPQMVPHPALCPLSLACRRHQLPKGRSVV